MSNQVYCVSMGPWKLFPAVIYKTTIHIRFADTHVTRVVMRTR